MKTIQQIAKKINNKIKVLDQHHGRLIIAIDGYAGSGKTSVAEYLARINPAYLVVHLDDFIKHWTVRKRMMDTATDRSRVFEYRWYRYDAIERLVKRFLRTRAGYIHLKVYDFDRNEFAAPRAFDLSKRILVVNGIFLLHPRHKRNALWHKRIFLRVDLRKADARRIAREKKKWDRAYLSEDHPNSYVRDFRVAYERYLHRYQPEQIADLVINVDGEKGT